MKKIIGRFFIILALVLTSISVCFPNDVDCSDNAYSSSPVKTAKSSGSQEDHHCSGLSCNSWMNSFSNKDVQSNVVIISQLLFSFKLSTYPQISLSTDKPPTV
jgi:hypothetical protein